jgi:[ribosomal protein S18]-alanine N-acetyltransferase
MGDLLFLIGMVTPALKLVLLPSVRIRRARAADVPAMIVLEQQSPPAAHWSQPQYQDLFESGQQRSGRFAWILEDENGTPEILGFLVAHRVDDEWELENIVVAETARRQGVGSRLISEFVAHARSLQGSRIFLEVRQSNHSARALYGKIGFQETGLRKSYYSNPPEDAILCRLSLY